MAREFDKDATYSGQKEIADAIKGISVSVAPDTTLSVAGKPADAKAAGDAIGAVDDKIGAVAADGNYIKASETKDVCENIGILDTRAKTNADAIGTVADDGNYIKASETKNVCENLGILDTRAKTNADAVSTLNTLIADDGTTKTLFGLVVSIDAGTGVVSLSEPVVESSET